MALDLPVVEGHPNRVPFYGVLTYVGVPSDKSPNGGRGHRIILKREAVVDALPSLLGMAINYAAGKDTHDVRQKCGIITSASLEQDELRIQGFVYGCDFPDLLKDAENRKLGMSYEAKDVNIVDMRKSIWEANKLTFTGAAVLLAEKAAYKSTSFNIGQEPLWAKASTGFSFSGLWGKTLKSDQLQAAQ